MDDGVPDREGMIEGVQVAVLVMDADEWNVRLAIEVMKSTGVRTIPVKNVWQCTGSVSKLAKKFMKCIAVSLKVGIVGVGLPKSSLVMGTLGWRQRGTPTFVVTDPASTIATSLVVTSELNATLFLVKFAADDRCEIQLQQLFLARVIPGLFLPA